MTSDSNSNNEDIIALVVDNGSGICKGTWWTASQEIELEDQQKERFLTFFSSSGLSTSIATQLDSLVMTLLGLYFHR